MAHIHDIWISPGHDFRGRHGKGRGHHDIIRVDEVVCHAGQGVVGDRYYGEDPGGKRQLSMLDRDVFLACCRALGVEQLESSALRRNLVVSGIDLNSLVGRRFRLGSVLLEGVEECAPCYWMDEAVGAGAFDFLKGRGGLRCRILSDGLLSTGDTRVDVIEGHDATEKSAVVSLAGVQCRDDDDSNVLDAASVEWPLQIVVNGKPYSMTMCTPGNERYLVRGLLHAEGLVDSSFLVYGETERPDYRTVHVEVSCDDSFRNRRASASVSSCGLCGRESAEDLFGGVEPVKKEVAVSLSLLERVQDEMRRRQEGFAVTGGSHAAAAADAGGEVLCLFEDVGRHNAVDKVVGFLLEEGTLSQAAILSVSGRLSFEIVQKCARAGIPVLAAVSAPSSLAVILARRWGITLAAFCREGRATIYSGMERLDGRMDGAKEFRHG